VPPIDLSDQDIAVLIESLQEAIARDRVFPLPPPVVERLKGILERLRAAGPTKEPRRQK
jgi:hypothetical protein